VRVVVTCETRFDQAPDGSTWTKGALHYSFWQRYLEVFDHVCVVARTRPVQDIPPGALRADGPGISFVPVPYYVGPAQYLRQIREVRRTLRNAAGSHDAVILRAPSVLAYELAKVLRRRGQAYAVEVIGDPWDVFTPGAVRHPLRPLMRHLFARELRKLSARAEAAAYVTEEALQRRYPPAPGAYSTHYSSVRVSASAFASEARCARLVEGPIRIVTVGSLEQRYKGVDVLLESVALLCRDGLDLRLVVVGDGRYRGELEEQAAKLSLSERVVFTGRLPAGEAVQAELDRANLFVLASRTEGLPRAMIEAMARALPCIGTAVGGIPELLEPEDLVPPNNAVALAAKVREVVTNPERMAQMSARNLAKAAEYREDVLRERRLGFYRYVRRQVEARIAASTSGHGWPRQTLATRA